MRIEVRSNTGDGGRGGRGMRGGGGSEPDYINQDWRASRNTDDRDRDDGR